MDIVTPKVPGHKTFGSMSAVVPLWPVEVEAISSPE